MPGTVLVVDDDPVFRSPARRMNVADGLVVVGEADSVATATAAARELKPDALLVDVGLPDGDGITLARELTALLWRPRIVLTSTDPDARVADRTVRAAPAASSRGRLPDARVGDRNRGCHSAGCGFATRIPGP